MNRHVAYFVNCALVSGNVVPERVLDIKNHNVRMSWTTVKNPALWGINHQEILKGIQKWGSKICPKCVIKNWSNTYFLPYAPFNDFYKDFGFLWNHHFPSKNRHNRGLLGDGLTFSFNFNILGLEVSQFFDIFWTYTGQFWGKSPACFTPTKLLTFRSSGHTPSSLFVHSLPPVAWHPSLGSLPDQVLGQISPHHYSFKVPPSQWSRAGSTFYKLQRKFFLCK